MNTHGRAARGEALPKFSRTGLPDTVRHVRICLAAAKSAAWIGLQPELQRTTRAMRVFFVQPSSTRNLSYDGLGRSSFGGAGSL